jgi:hypothetical protein
VKNIKTPDKIIDVPLLVIHGGAGTGKSKLIRDISQWAELTFTNPNDRSLEQPYIIRLAFTGKAASLIDGLTLHSAFNFKFNNDFTSLSDKTRDNLRTTLQFLKIIIIDEISMIKSDMMYQLNLRLQEIMQSDKIFGGVCVLLFGDLMQLKPIMARWIFEEPSCPQFKETFVTQNLWKQFKVIELTVNHRQGEDAEYANLLGRVRFGQQTNDDNLLLQSRINLSPPKNYLHVYGKNYLVQNFNKAQLKEIEGELYSFPATHLHPWKTNYSPPISEGGFVGKTPFLNVLELKKNAQVMLIYNIDTADSLTNGVIGEVIDFVREREKII